MYNKIFDALALGFEICEAVGRSNGRFLLSKDFHSKYKFNDICVTTNALHTQEVKKQKKKQTIC